MDSIYLAITVSISTQDNASRLLHILLKITQKEMRGLQDQQARIADKIEMVDDDLRTSIWNTVLESATFLNQQCNLVLLRIHEESLTSPGIKIHVLPKGSYGLRF